MARCEAAAPEKMGGDDESARPSFGALSTTSIVSIAIGPRGRIYAVHADLLINYSAYFRALLKGGFAEGQASRQKKYEGREEEESREEEEEKGEVTITRATLPDFSEETFEAYLDWLYYGRLPKAPGGGCAEASEEKGVEKEVEESTVVPAKPNGGRALPKLITRNLFDVLAPVDMLTPPLTPISPALSAPPLSATPLSATPPSAAAAPPTSTSPPPSPPSPLPTTSPTELLLVTLYALSLYTHTASLQASLLTLLHRTAHTTAWIPWYSTIQLAYTLLPPNAPLCRLFVEIYAVKYVGDEEEVEAREAEGVPVGFWVGVVRGMCERVVG